MRIAAAKPRIRGSNLAGNEISCLPCCSYSDASSVRWLGSRKWYHQLIEKKSKPPASIFLVSNKIFMSLLQILFNSFCVLQGKWEQPEICVHGGVHLRCTRWVSSPLTACILTDLRISTSLWLTYDNHPGSQTCQALSQSWKLTQQPPIYSRYYAHYCLIWFTYVYQQILSHLLCVAKMIYKIQHYYVVVDTKYNLSLNATKTSPSNITFPGSTMYWGRATARDQPDSILNICQALIAMP